MIYTKSNAITLSSVQGDHWSDPTGIWRSQRARRNEIQRLERKLQGLDKEVSVASTQKRQRDKQAALTKLVRELVEQVQGLVEEVTSMKRQFQQQLQSNRLCDNS